MLRIGHSSETLFSVVTQKSPNGRRKKWGGLWPGEALALFDTRLPYEWWWQFHFPFCSSNLISHAFPRRLPRGLLPPSAPAASSTIRSFLPSEGSNVSAGNGLMTAAHAT